MRSIRYCYILPVTEVHTVHHTWRRWRIACPAQLTCKLRTFSIAQRIYAQVNRWDRVEGDIKRIGTKATIGSEHFYPKRFYTICAGICVHNISVS